MERLADMSGSILMAIVIIWFVYRYLRRQFEADYAELTKPLLVCAFSAVDLGCCVSDVTISFRAFENSVLVNKHVMSDYYRVKVETTSPFPINGCAGFVTTIDRDGTSIFSGHNLHLTFAPAEGADAVSKQIRPGVPEYLDLLAITEHDQIIIATKGYSHPSVASYPELFANTGLYTLHVVVSSANAPAARITIDLNWNGSRSSAEVATRFPPDRL